MALTDLERLYRRIRRMIGNPDECEIDAEWIEEIVEDALLRYSRYNPIREAVAIPVVKDVRSYAMPNGYFEVDHTVLIGDSTVGIPDLTGFDAVNTVLYRGLESGGLHVGDMNARRALHIVESAERTFPSVKFWQEGGMLVTDPTPVRSETVYVPLLKAHTEATFPAIHKQELRLLAASMAAYERAAQLGKLTEVKMSATQTVKFRSPSWLREEGDRLFKEFRDRMKNTGFVAEIA